MTNFANYYSRPSIGHIEPVTNVFSSGGCVTCHKGWHKGWVRFCFCFFSRCTPIWAHSTWIFRTLDSLPPLIQCVYIFVYLAWNESYLGMILSESQVHFCSNGKGRVRFRIGHLGPLWRPQCAVSTPHWKRLTVLTWRYSGRLHVLGLNPHVSDGAGRQTLTLKHNTNMYDIPVVGAGTNYQMFSSNMYTVACTSHHRALGASHLGGV